MFLDRSVTHDLDAWFERAVDCCAFLIWRLTSQGVAVHFRSNGYAMRQPEEGDVYAILKYLALVYPQIAAAAECPVDENSYRIVFTPAPERFREAGWTGARILSSSDLPAPPPAGLPIGDTPAREWAR
jgi:hypothetical protein